MIKKPPIAVNTIRAGIGIVVVFFGCFGVWSALAPIGSSAIATGQLVLDFNRKTIQHFEGGIIEKIHVKEGQSVVRGAPLMVLQDINAKAQKELLTHQLISASAVKQRLIAEQNNEETLDFSNVKEQFNEDSQLVQILNTQNDLFLARKKTFESKDHILSKRIDQLNDEIEGLRAQKDAVTRQLGVLEKETVIIQQLVKHQNAPITQLMAIQKQRAQLDGQSGDIQAKIAKAKQMISETELEMIHLHNDSHHQILAELQEVNIHISDLTEQLISAKDILKRTVIKAPISGVVMNIKYHTLGAVVQPAANILNIVPQDDQIIVEAKVKPDDIDSVHKGLIAMVQLTAFNAKKVPKLAGTVRSVSADALMDEATGMHYFLARIQLDQGDISRLKTTLTLNPGMPAQVFVMTGSRTLLNYLLSPIIDATYKAFREE